MATARDYRSVLDKWLLPSFGSKQLDALTAASLTSWRRSRMEAGEMPRRTAGKVVSVLHAIFEFARREFAHGVNPVAAMERLPVRYDGGRFDFYTAEEVWSLARATTSEQDATIILVAAFAGLRRGEVLALRWRDIDFDRQAIRVENNLSGDGQLGTPKSGQMRSVPMAPDVAQALARLGQRTTFITREDFVFVNEMGRPLDGSAVRRRVVSAQKKAGLRELRFHDLRHLFGTIAANAALRTRAAGLDGARRFPHHSALPAVPGARR